MSDYRGVTLVQRPRARDRYKVQLNALSRNFTIGYFEIDDAKQAAEAYDNAAYYASIVDKVKRRLNFPGDYEREEHIPPMTSITRNLSDQLQSIIEHAGVIVSPERVTLALKADLLLLKKQFEKVLSHFE